MVSPAPTGPVTVYFEDFPTGISGWAADATMHGNTANFLATLSWITSSPGLPVGDGCLGVKGNDWTGSARSPVIPDIQPGDVLTASLYTSTTNPTPTSSDASSYLWFRFYSDAAGTVRISDSTVAAGDPFTVQAPWKYLTTVNTTVPAGTVATRLMVGEALEATYNILFDFMTVIRNRP